MNTPISRRSSLRRLSHGSALIGLSALLDSRLAAADGKGSGLKGHINHSVCQWCYPDVSLEDLCKAGKAMGLASIELVGPESWPTLKKHGMMCAMAKSVHPRIAVGWNRLENHDDLVKRYTHIIPLAAAAAVPNLVCLSGNRGGMDDELGLEHCVVGLKRVLPLAERHKVTICLEMLNSKVNHKDYMADSTAWALELVKRLGSERFKLLYDIYHMQIMEGNIIATIQAHHGSFAHYHTGGVPGRNEIDDTQELNYPAIMRAIVATGFKGFVAQEFRPSRGDDMASLRQAVRICDV